MSLRIIVVGALAAGFAFAAAGAQPAPPGKIYSCVGKDGRKITQDHPVAECADTDQIERNKDGSFKRVVPRQETEEERSTREARERVDAAERARLLIEERADRQLLRRYPTKAKHDEERMKELGDIRRSIEKIDERRKSLLAERKPLLDEAEFYPGKPLPPKLKSAIDFNDGALAAQESLRQGQEAELARNNKRFDDELERLRKMWAAPPGAARPNASAPSTK